MCTVSTNYCMHLRDSAKYSNEETQSILPTITVTQLKKVLYCHFPKVYLIPRNHNKAHLTLEHLAFNVSPCESSQMASFVLYS